MSAHRSPVKSFLFGLLLLGALFAWLFWPRSPRKIRVGEARVYAVRFSSDGKALAVGGSSVRLIDRDSGKELQPPHYERDQVVGVEFSADRRFIMSRCVSLSQPNHSVTLGGCEVGSGGSTSPPDELSRRADFRLNGRTPAEGAPVTPYNARGERIPLEGLTEKLNCLSFSPDGALLAGGTGDLSDGGRPGLLRVWDAHSGRLQATYPLRDTPVTAVDFSPDGTTVASAGYDGEVRLWDVGHLSDQPEQKPLTPAQTVVGPEASFRGLSASRWRERLLRGELRFGGWMHDLNVTKTEWWWHGPAWVYQVLRACGVDTGGETSVYLPYSEPESRRITPVLAEWLRDPDPFVRAFGAHALGAYGNWDWRDMAVAALVRALRDEDPDVRYEAARSLGRFDGVRLEPSVEKLVVANNVRGRAGWRCGTSAMSDRRLEQICPEGHWKSVFAASRGVTDEGLAHLRGCDALQALYLQGSGVTDAGLKHLKGLMQLRLLDVRDTKVTDAGVREVQRERPELKVVR